MSEWLDRAFPLIPLSDMEVVQDGRVVGTVSASFSPYFARSKSMLFDVRPGDFKEIDGKIHASKMLGYGDLLSLEGFTPS